MEGNEVHLRDADAVGDTLLGDVAPVMAGNVKELVGSMSWVTSRAPFP